MKSLLKFSLLLALVIGGKLAKQSAPAVAVKPAEAPAASTTSMMFVSEKIPAQPLKATAPQAQAPQHGAGLMANLF